MYRSRFTMRMAMICLLVVGFYSTAVFVFATPPGSPYNPAETLNPTCAPGDTNCYVALASGGVSLTNGLQTIGSDIGLGGTLTQDTTVDLDSTYSMQFLDGDFSSITNTTLGPSSFLISSIDNISSGASPYTFDSAEIGDTFRSGSLMEVTTGTLKFKLFNGIGAYNEDFDGTASQPMPTISALSDDSLGSGAVTMNRIHFAEGVIINSRHSITGTLATPDLESNLSVRDSHFFIAGVDYTADKSYGLDIDTGSLKLTNANAARTVTHESFTVLSNGDVGVGIDNFSSGTNGNVFQVGDRSTGIIGYVDDLTGNWVAVSDARKKHDIVDIGYGLDQVNALRPVSFKYNRNNEETIGFLAQQVLPIIPEAVSGSDAEGYGMSYQTLTPVLVKAIQELDVKIANIEALSVSNESSRSSIITWFADAANGIQDFFAKRIITENLCVSDASGNQTCVTKSQLDALLQLVPGSAPTAEIVPVVPPIGEPVPEVVSPIPEVPAASDTVVPSEEPTVTTDTVPVSE